MIILQIAKIYAAGHSTIFLTTFFCLPILEFITDKLMLLATKGNETS